MSAFIVGDKLINIILEYLNRNGKRVYTHNNVFLIDDLDHLTKMAQILVDENYRSVNFRYNENTKPHKIEYSPVAAFQELPPVNVLKACNCYDYQSCETQDYHESEAFQIIEAARTIAIHNLPGYDQAPWDIN